MNGDNLGFKIRVRTVEYGDACRFTEYRLLFLQGSQVVGIEDGPRRETTTRHAALKAARSRLRVLRRHRLFAIRVTRKDISIGEARSCSTCAIAQALWHNQERMGLPKHEYDFEVAPYGFMARDLGIRLHKRRESYEDMLLPVEQLPDMVVPGSGPKFYPDSMEEWAMHWDDWADSRHMTLREWHENRDPDGKPGRPGPAAFVLDLDLFKPISENVVNT